MCVVAVTNHGLEPRKWIGRFIALIQERGIHNGPLYRDPMGGRLKASYFEPRFFDRLEYVRIQKPQLMPGVEDVVEDYGVSRSFRRGATSEVVNQKLPPEVIDANNRWRRMEQAGASHPAMVMRDNYTDVRQTLDLRLEFSRAL